MSGVVFTPAAADRIGRATRWVEAQRQGGREPAGPGRGVEPVWARVTSGTADGDGYYPGVITLRAGDDGSWSDYSAVKVGPLNGETLTNAARYAVRPSGRTSAGDELYTVIGATVAASGATKVIYVSGPSHDTIEDIYWSSIRPYDWTTYSFTTVGAVNCWSYDVLGTYANSGYYIGVLIGQLEGMELYVIHSPLKALGPVGDDESGTTYTVGNYPQWLFDWDSGFRFAVEGSPPSNNLITSITGASLTQGGIVTANGGVSPNQYFGSKGFYEYLEVASPFSQASLGLVNPEFVSTLHSGSSLSNPGFWVNCISQAEPENPDHAHEQMDMAFDFATGMCEFVKGRTVSYGGSSNFEYDGEFCLAVNGHGGISTGSSSLVVCKGGIVVGVAGDLATGIIDGGEWA